MRLRLLATLACLIPSAAFGDASIPALPVPSGGVMIFNQGTAELAGYRIVVASTGDSVAIDGAGRGDRRLSAQLTQALFADLAAAVAAGADCIDGVGQRYDRGCRRRTGICR